MLPAVMAMAQRQPVRSGLEKSFHFKDKISGSEHSDVVKLQMQATPRGRTVIRTAVAGSYDLTVMVKRASSSRWTKKIILN